VRLKIILNERFRWFYYPRTQVILFLYI